MTVLRRGLLSDFFTGVAAKKLTLVETVSSKSNQHEFQGTKPLKALFGTDDRREMPTRFIWLSEEQTALTEVGFLSWSNVRKGKPRAPEYHLYYSKTAVTEMMKPGDAMFLALRPDGTTLVIIAPAGSTMQNQLVWLFGVSIQASSDFEFKDIEHGSPAELDFAARYILDELGLDIEEPSAARLDEFLEPFGMDFPNTKMFSELARSSLGQISPQDDADKVLMAWAEQEELLFRRLERKIVAERLRSGFMASADNADVEGFLSFSLSVQNRRKSRAGQSLENHLEVLFKARDIRYQRGAETENRNRPDFIFPGQTEYRDLSFNAENLTMLGAKSTLKDRWRQVLSEAERIKTKHLLTLEPSISIHQTDEMQAKALQLVVPVKLHQTYRESQRLWLFSVEDFLKLVTERQSR